MRATWPGARSGRISMTTLPFEVSRIIVSSGFAISSAFRCSLQRVPLLFDRRLLDEIHPWIVLLQIGIAFHLQPALVGAATARRALAVLGVELVDHLHALDHLAERRETLAIETGVVSEIDEHLTGAGVRSRHRVGDEAALVALRHLV